MQPMQLVCPVCSDLLELSNEGRTLRCISGHSFDRAKQGYWNLLLVQSKRSKDPGDNPEMVQARTRFLDSGFYQPVLQTLCETLDRLVPHSVAIADLGCGEGYYTSGLQQHRLAQGYADEILGLDISKHAVRAAARRSKEITWAVGSSARIPVPDASLDLALIIFSKILSEPLERVLKPGATLLVAYPGPAHLMSLRELIYDEVRESESDPISQLSDAFTLEKTLGSPFEIELKGNQQISDLLAMTPHGQRMRESKREQLLSLASLVTEVDIRFAQIRYQPRPSDTDRARDCDIERQLENE